MSNLSTISYLCGWYLRDEKDDGAAEAADEAGGEHDLHTVGEHSHEPTGREGDGGEDEHPLAAELHGDAAEDGAEERAEQGEAGDPGGLLLTDEEGAAEVAGVQGVLLLLLDGGDGGRAVALAQAGGEGPEGHCEGGGNLQQRRLVKETFTLAGNIILFKCELDVTK